MVPDNIWPYMVQYLYFRILQFLCREVRIAFAGTAAQAKANLLNLEVTPMELPSGSLTWLLKMAIHIGVCWIYLLVIVFFESYMKKYQRVREIKKSIGG